MIICRWPGISKMCIRDSNVTEDRYVFEKKPNWPWPANQNIGLERPLELVPGKKYNIKMIVDDTIATIYVDGEMCIRDRHQDQ